MVKPYGLPLFFVRSASQKRPCQSKKREHSPDKIAEGGHKWNPLFILGNIDGPRLSRGVTKLYAVPDAHRTCAVSGGGNYFISNAVYIVLIYGGIRRTIVTDFRYRCHLCHG